LENDPPHHLVMRGNADRHLLCLPTVSPQIVNQTVPNAPGHRSYPVFVQAAQPTKHSLPRANARPWELRRAQEYNSEDIYHV